MNPVYLVVIVAFVVVAFFYSYAMYQKTASAGKKFLAEHPDAAKVYLASKVSIVSEMVYVTSVDGEFPATFSEPGKLPIVIPGIPGSKNGIYVLPGTRSLELQYTHNRPGIMYKNVTSSTGLVKKDIVVEANKSYMLGFDRKAEAFTFEEYQG
jgi:hypothetical protein